MEAEQKEQGRHFVLVHGACHGAWCWYKIKPRLEAVGHRVTALDMAASGINRKDIHEVHSMHDYSQPFLEMMAALPPNERVILVGHSLGAMNLAVAMEKYPEKVSVAVFLTAFMPDTMNQPSYVMDQFVKRIPEDAWLDTQFSPYGGPEKSLNSMFFGHKFLSIKLYQLSPIEDLELAFALARPSSLFLEDLAELKKFSNEGYGSVARVYIKCDEDVGISEEFQQWLIENNGEVKEVMNIKGADHMPMFSKPQELCACLLKVAHKYG